MEKEKFYITTSIAYASAKPHIGNTYEMILADAIARFKRLQGFDVYFQTGTDEHGQKIQQTAEKQNMLPKDYVDEVTKTVKNIWDMMNISYDRFVRTTDEQHKNQVQKIFNKMYEKGDIYLGEYEGYYCVACEAFYTEKQLLDGKCPECGKEVELTKEEVYFFNLKKYQEQLIKHIENNPDFIQPESRKNEMINNFLKPGLHDLSVSRTSFNWGVPVGFNEEHVVYVWLDALSNYITNIGYDVDKSSEEFDKLWPADIHLVGKDIMRFHTIYWPIFLLSLGAELPKTIFGHPWLLTDNSKMSKSTGNVLYADDLAKLFSVDIIRYYVLSEVPYANDGNISYDLIIDKTNADLVNTLGNLLNRTLGMTKKYFNNEVKFHNVESLENEKIITKINELETKMIKKFDKYEVGAALSLIFDLLHDANKFIDVKEPWSLAKDPTKHEELEDTLFILLELLRVSSILLSVFIPETAEKIKAQLNNNHLDLVFNFNNGYVVNEAEIIFPRIDKEEKLKEITEAT